MVLILNLKKEDARDNPILLVTAALMVLYAAATAGLMAAAVALVAVATALIAGSQPIEEPDEEEDNGAGVGG